MVIGVTLVNLYLTYAIQRKLGLKGWEFFVPLYNLWVFFDITTGKPKRAFLLLLIFVPFVGSLIVLIICLLAYIQFAKKLAALYNKKTIWTFFLEQIYLAAAIFKDAPNCDDPINQFVTKLFGLKAESVSAEEPLIAENN